VALPLKEIWVNSPFGMRRDPMNRKKSRMHNGLDLRAKYENVYSMLPGTVTDASFSQNGGYYVTVNHGSCVCSYLHLSEIKVRKGQHVSAGGHHYQRRTIERFNIITTAATSTKWL